jgi:phosphate:Na+ symporter
MRVELFFDLITQLIGGLGLFLIGMKYMSEGMQAVAGKRLRKMISAVTDNRIMACATGTFITCLIQSSSVCSVMVIGFVNAGVMNLMQAIGVIIGSNIGTTFTGWILAIHIGKYGLPILGLAAFVFLFAKRDQTRYAALAVLGIGMVFFGMEIMSTAFKIPEVRDTLRAIFATLSGNSFSEVVRCATVGAVATILVQSSSATLGITIALAQSGAICYNTAAGLIIGLNIGTTITAVLAAINSSPDGKRVAAIHVFFNLVGTLWLIPVFKQYTGLIESIVGLDGPIGTKIALTHTLFNVINTIVFLPFIGHLALLVKKIIPEKKKVVHHLSYFDIRAINTPALAVVQSKDQLIFMAESITGMLRDLRVVGGSFEGDPDLEHKIFHGEETLDNVQKEIFVFLGKLVAGEVSHSISAEVQHQIRLADEYETLSDYVVHVLKGHLKLRKTNQHLSEKGREELLALHDKVANYIEKTNQALLDEDGDFLPWASKEGAAITALMKQYRQNHLQRLADGEVDALQSLIFTDMLNCYRRMKDHGKNIAQVLAGEK